MKTPWVQTANVPSATASETNTVGTKLHTAGVYQCQRIGSCTRQETCPLRSYRREWAPLRCGRSVAWVVKKLECLFTKATRGQHKKTYKYIFYIGNTNAMYTPIVVIRVKGDSQKRRNVETRKVH
jgi:hypothetical protein